MNGRPWLRLAVLALALAGAGAVAPTVGAQEGPIVVGQREPLRWLSLDPPLLTLELLGRRQSDRLKPAGAAALETNDTTLRETINLITRGAVLHPNLVELSLNVTAGLEQQSFQNNQGPDDRSNSTFYAYDLAATFLRRESVPVTLYARRTQDWVSREFGPSLDQLLEQVGAVVEVRSRTLPSRFEVYRLNQELTDPQGQDNFTQRQDTFLWHTEWRPSDRQRLTWDYTLSDVQATAALAAPASYVINDASLAHSIDFGRDQKSNLASTIAYFDQTGDFAQEHVRWDEALRLQHTPNFDTTWQYTLDEQQRQNLDQIQHRAQLSARHKLYESLLTTARVGDLYLETSQGDRSNEIYGDVRWDYRKRVPYGVLSADAELAYSYRDAKAQSGPLLVNDLSRTFSNGTPIIITGQNIDATSFLITDAINQARIFSPLTDYVLVPAPNRIIIQRVPTGAILPNQTVLIDYMLLAQPANITKTRGVGFGARYDVEQGALRGLAVYAHYFFQNQDIDTDVASSFIDDDIRDLLLGAEYRAGDLTLSAEQEYHKSNIAPFNATRLNARWQGRLGMATYLVLNANYIILENTDIDDRTRYLTLSATLDWQVTRGLHAVANAAWRDQRGDLLGSATGLEQEVRLEWRHRQTTIFGGVRNTIYNTDTQDNHFLLLELGLRRVF